MNTESHPATPFERVLFCTDFSESADAAFAFALDAVVRRPGCVLHLLHVLHEVDAQFWKTYLYEVENVDEQARKAIDQKIHDDYLSKVPGSVQTVWEVRAGPDADTILEYARQHRIDLIVIGRKGRGGVGRALFGKVAEKVVRKADCVVMVVPFHKPEISSATPGPH